MFISRQQVQEHETHKFCAEASELGFGPGLFPRVLNTDLGNGQPLKRSYVSEHYVEYTQMYGCITLRVYND